MVADVFAKEGHKVTWWSSTYLHYDKCYYKKKYVELETKSKVELKLLHSKYGYKNNISIKRILYSRELAYQFYIRSKKFEKPNIIYCSWPLIDFAYEAIKLGQKFHIPVVIDIRDSWPDIFIQPFPELLQPIVKLLVNLLFKRKVSFVMKFANTIVGVVPKALKFAESYGRKIQPNDHVVHLAYDNTQAAENEIVQANEFWRKQGLQMDKCIVSFIGTISNRIGDFDTLIEAAEKCKDSSITFVFCGTGNYLNELIKKCKNLKNVIIPGYRNRAEIQALLKLSIFGLLAYRNTDDFIDSLPNKFGEYLSQGLIILTSLKGASRQIVEKENCGAYYHDAVSLLEVIELINSSSIEKRRMSQNSLNLFYKEFDASKVYSDFYRLLESQANVYQNKGRTINYEQI